MKRALIALLLPVTLAASTGQAFAAPRQVWPQIQQLPVAEDSPSAKRFAGHHAEAAHRPRQVGVQQLAQGGPWSWYAADFASLVTPPWAIEHQDITVDLNAAKSTLKTTLVLTLVFNEPTEQLQLVTGSVTKAVVTAADGTPVESKLTQLNGMSLLGVTLPQAASPTDKLQLKVETQATLDCSPEGIGLLPCGLGATYQWVTFHRYYLQAALAGHAPFTSDLHVITPADRLAAAPGLLSGSELMEDGRKVHHFKQIERTDNAGFAVADYEALEGKLEGGQPLRIFTAGKFVPYADNILGLVQDVTSWYGERFAKFPWSSLNIIQLDKDFGGGYAPLSSVFMYRDVFGAQPGTGFWQQTVELTAHELGHQWWGNYVEPYSVGDVALSESLAEESSCWYTEKTLDSRSQLIGNHLSYLYTVPPTQDVAVGSQNVYNSAHYVAVVYHKGSAVLDMLRAMIGDEAMAKGLALYAKSFGRDYARLDDLRKAMEEASGQKLSWFWQQWFNKTGPIRAEVAGRLVNNGGQWAVRLRFAQPAQGNSPSAPAPKRFSVDVTIDYADSTQDVIAVEIAPVGDEPVIAEVPVKAQPVRVRLDVQRKLLRMWATATPGDFNFSGLVDGADLVELALRHGRAVRVIGKSGQEFFFSDTAWNELYDLQPDLRVDMLDVDAFSGWVGTEAEQF